MMDAAHAQGVSELTPCSIYILYLCIPRWDPNAFRVVLGILLTFKEIIHVYQELKGVCNNNNKDLYVLTL